MAPRDPHLLADQSVLAIKVHSLLAVLADPVLVVQSNLVLVDLQGLVLEEPSVQLVVVLSDPMSGEL